MKTLAVLSRKGGTGKTTLAIHLAVAAERAGHTTILIDLDPQASAAKWNDHREGDTPFVVTAPPSRLTEVLNKAADGGATLAILDTAPHTEIAALDAASVAEMALIPCKPALIDLQAITSTINVIRLANVPARIVFNAVPARGDRVDQAREAVKVFDVPCAPCEVGNRIAFSDSYNAGLTAQEYEPRGKASREIRELYTYISTEMGV
ncbi:AAA family ATPase [Candidatus Poribacteria bacterium]|nr:AAA family ATPase [Candidatus Poribacteria bacterium]MYH83462.1 AAA family ATPase [Candidatus Poribacteria bacterium]MYK95873.1 AAA family ATPase [Candidatus Poribacteria bacterium]